MQRFLPIALALATLGAAGCADDGPAGLGLAGEPVVTVGPNPTTPLVAVVEATTGSPALVRLTIDDGVDRWTVSGAEEPDTEHRIPIYGLRPDTDYTLDVVAIDGDDRTGESAATLTFATPELPEGFPDFEVLRAADSSASGVTMFAARYDTGDEAGSYLVMLDGAGDVVWYYDDGVGISDARRLTNGNLLFLYGGNRGMREIDMLGNVVAEWTAIGWDDSIEAGAVPVDTDSFHHEVVELPAGDPADFVTLSTELRPYADYPAEEIDPTVRSDGEVGVLGDTIVTFRRDGTIVEELSLLDILDPYRISYDSLGTDWKVVYGDEDTRDWSHANAVVLDPADGNFIVSLRNQDAVVKIDRTSGELLWILGDPGRWDAPWSDVLLQPATGTEWSYHQHAPMFTPSGTMVLFDNGNGRAVPPAATLDDADRYSRVVEYRVDEAAGVVEQVWAYGGPGDGWYSGALGDADYQAETDTVLVTDGFRVDDERHWARVFEVSAADPAEVVWEVAVSDPDVDWTVYRAERLASVDPAG